MSSTPPPAPFLQVLAASVKVIDKAGDAIRDIMAGGKLDIVEKEGKDDLQTKADRYVNDLLCGFIKRQFPNVAVIGEEGEVTDQAAKSDDAAAAGHDQSVIDMYEKKLPDEATNAAFEDLTVWIDPLDGTKEYTEGFLDHVTVLIGIAIGNKAMGE